MLNKNVLFVEGHDWVGLVHFLFHARGPAIAKLWAPNFVHMSGTSRSQAQAEANRRTLIDVTHATGWQKSAMHYGACLRADTVCKRFSGIRNLCSLYLRSGVTRSYFLPSSLIFAAAFNTRWSLFLVDNVMPATRALQQSTLTTTKLFTSVLAPSSGSARQKRLMRCGSL